MKLKTSKNVQLMFESVFTDDLKPRKPCHSKLFKTRNVFLVFKRIRSKYYWCGDLAF